MRESKFRDDVVAIGVISSIMLIFFSIAHLVENGLWLEEEYVLGDLVEINRFNYVPFVLIGVSILVIVVSLLVGKKSREDRGGVTK